MSSRVEIDGIRELLDAGAQLVEVLPQEEYDEEHLPGAINIPLKTLDAESTATLHTLNPVVAYCWAYLRDRTPRAACPLETLGFEAVYDYVPGKVDWIARGLPTEGGEAPPPRVGKLARDDVATCGLKDRVEEIQTSPYGFCLVLAEDGTVLGRVRRSDMNGHTAEDAMSPGP